MTFNAVLARQAAEALLPEPESTQWVNSFVEICRFLSDNQQSLSAKVPEAHFPLSAEKLKELAKRYVGSLQRPTFPRSPQTIPDEMVSVVLQVAFGYSEEESEQIKLTHQRAMAAENCVGGLLERYLAKTLQAHGWHWCCGEFVRATDFVRYDDQSKQWETLQVKNRDNTENSSSSRVRHNTTIQKWHRTFSRTGRTNWDNMPPSMQNLGLSEEGFTEFVKAYLAAQKERQSEKPASTSGVTETDIEQHDG